jgi:transcriptional regulator with XRE-family HTH domain
MGSPETDLSRRLQRLLDERGLSVSEAARMIGMEKQQCWLIVTGRNKNPGYLTLLKIVEGVGGTMKELFCEEE